MYITKTILYNIFLLIQACGRQKDQTSNLFVPSNTTGGNSIILNDNFITIINIF